MQARILTGLALLALATAAAGNASATVPAWVTASNADTTRLLEAQAKFAPEEASDAGLTQYDGLAIDLGPDINARYIAAMQIERDRVQVRLASEKDPQLRQDLEILSASIVDDVTGTRLGEKYNLPWVDVPQLMFGNLQSLLQAQLPALKAADPLGPGSPWLRRDRHGNHRLRARSEPGMRPPVSKVRRRTGEARPWSPDR